MLASEAPSSSISKNQKKSFKPGHFYAKLSIKIDIPKCLKITVVMLILRYKAIETGIILLIMEIKKNTFIHLFKDL